MAALIAPDIGRAKRLVIKIGSALLVDRVTGLRQDWLAALALDVAETQRWRLELHRAFDDAYARTHLPERPDYARAEAWLIGARRAALEG